MYKCVENVPMKPEIGNLSKHNNINPTQYTLVTRLTKVSCQPEVCDGCCSNVAQLIDAGSSYYTQLDPVNKY